MSLLEKRHPCLRVSAIICPYARVVLNSHAGIWQLLRVSDVADCCGCDHPRKVGSLGVAHYPLVVGDERLESVLLRASDGPRCIHVVDVARSWIDRERRVHTGSRLLHLCDDCISRGVRDQLSDIIVRCVNALLERVSCRCHHGFKGALRHSCELWINADKSLCKHEIRVSRVIPHLRGRFMI